MLHIVHLNDTEGPITEVWPPVATAVRALREAGRCDVLLHAGDVPLGSPAAEATVRIMNTFGFDAVALGNHDLNDGVGALCAQAQRLLRRLAALGQPAGQAPGLTPVGVAQEQQAPVPIADDGQDAQCDLGRGQVDEQVLDPVGQQAPQAVE